VRKLNQKAKRKVSRNEKKKKKKTKTKTTTTTTPMNTSSMRALPVKSDGSRTSAQGENKTTTQTTEQQKTKQNKLTSR
jgi:hypothetical protein